MTRVATFFSGWCAALGLWNLVERNLWLCALMVVCSALNLYHAERVKNA